MKNPFKRAVQAILRRIFGPLFFGLALFSLTGCSLAVRAELLNPLNKSGRAETSTPVSAATPTPSPTPTPEGGK